MCGLFLQRDKSVYDPKKKEKSVFISFKFHLPLYRAFFLWWWMGHICLFRNLTISIGEDWDPKQHKKIIKSRKSKNAETWLRGL